MSRRGIRARRAVGDDLDELGAAIHRGGAVVTCDPGRESVREQARVDRAAALLAVEVGAVAAAEDPEPVGEAVELDRERVGHARLEPAVGAGRDAAEHGAALPAVAQGPVNAVEPPDREHVRGVASRDDDHVCGRDLLRRLLGNAEGEGDVRRARPRPPGALEGLDGAIGIACRRRQKHDVRLRHAGELEHEIVEWRRGIASEKAAATHRHDVPAHGAILA